jgi:hypothetical protein
MKQPSNEPGAFHAAAPRGATPRTYVVLALAGYGDDADFITPLGTIVAAGRRAAGEVAQLVYGGERGAAALRVVAAGSISPGMLVRALARDGDRMVA